MQEEKVINGFKADRSEQYNELLPKCQAFIDEIAHEFAIEKFTYAELEEEAELKKLQTWFEKIKK